MRAKYIVCFKGERQEWKELYLDASYKILAGASVSHMNCWGHEQFKSQSLYAHSFFIKMEGSYKIVKGDVTKPTLQDNNKGIVIPHCCNDVGSWGAGVVLAITKAFGPFPEECYRKWASQVDPVVDPRVTSKWFKLGDTQFVETEVGILGSPSIYIANMIGQHGVRTVNGIPPIRYDALSSAMIQVADFCGEKNCEIHCPKFGSGLAGGSWEQIEQYICMLWIDRGINVTVYEF